MYFLKNYEIFIMINQAFYDVFHHMIDFMPFFVCKATV